MQESAGPTGNGPGCQGGGTEGYRRRAGDRADGKCPKTAQLQQLEQEYRQARQEADALSRQDRQLAEVAERLKQMRDVADALRGDSGLLEPMYDREPFALDDVLQSGFQQAETAISGLRQAIVSYQEICGGSHTD